MRKGLKSKNSNDGSLTQWINICTCDQAPAAPLEIQPKVRCKTCGKQVIEKRAGSLTQWVFQQDSCDCDRPVAEEVSTGVFKQPSFRGFADADEAELKIDSGKFPLERYKPVDTLGSGANGTVYLSRDRLLGKRVAVKVLNTLDREALLAFQNEARTTSKLSHPHIVKILDFGSTESGIPFMVMEFLPGSSLEVYIKEYDGLDVDTTIELFVKLADALEYAHNARVLHRDLKPSNILVVNDDGELGAHLIDFGVAKVQEQQSTTIYNGTALVGTPSYMSPDQALGKEFDKRSDIYSLGCILFETLTAVKAFEADSPLETVSLHAHMPPPSILQFLNDNSQTRALDRIINCCLEKDPKLRFQTATALKQALKAISGDIKKSAGLETANSHTELNSEPQTISFQNTKKTRGGVAAAVIAGVAMTSTIFYYWVEQNFKNSDPRTYIANDAELGELRPPKKPDSTKALIAEAAPKVYNDSWLRKRLNANPAMRILSLSNSDISPQGISMLEAAPLRRLTVMEQPFTSAHFENLSKVKSLTSVKFINAIGTEFKGLSCLSKLPNLVDLQISNVEISQQMLQDIAEMKSIQDLNFSRSVGFDEASLAPLSKLPKLTSINLEHSDISDSSASQLILLQKLATLYIDHTKVSDKFLRVLAASPNLNEVHMTNCSNISTEAIDHFQNKNRVVVSLRDDPANRKISRFGGDVRIVGATDADVSKYAMTNPKIDSLTIIGSKISPNTIARLRSTGMQNLYLSQPFSLAHFHELAKIKSLTGLSIDYNKSVEFDGLASLQTLRISSLKITGARVTQALLKNIAKFKSLQSLSLPHGKGFDTTTVAPLAKLSKLTSFDASNSDITDSSIEPISSFPELNYIDVSGTELTDSFLTLASKMPKLRTVGMMQCNAINDSSVRDVSLHRPNLHLVF